MPIILLIVVTNNVKKILWNAQKYDECSIEFNGIPNIFVNAPKFRWMLEVLLNVQKFCEFLLMPTWNVQSDLLLGWEWKSPRTFWE